MWHDIIMIIPTIFIYQGQHKKGIQNPLFPLCYTTMCYIQIHKSWRKRQRVFLRMVVEYGPRTFYLQKIGRYQNGAGPYQPARTGLVDRSILFCRWIMSLFTGHASNKFYKRKLVMNNGLTHSHTMTPFDASGKEAFWKHCGKRRNCSQRAISPFPTVFSTCLDNFLPFLSNLKLSSANSFSLEESKIFRLVKG